MPRFVGYNSSATNFTVKSTLHPARAKNIPPSTTFDFYLSDDEVVEIRAMLATLSGVSFSEMDSTEEVKLVAIAGAPAALSNTAVHAAVAANAANLFTTATPPDVPRNLIAVFQNLYDGGTVTIVGTDQFDKPVTETFAAVGGGGTRTGAKIFKTISSITKATVGATTNTVSIGYGNKLGLAWPFTSEAALFVTDVKDDTCTWDATYAAVTPAAGVVPNASRTYKALVAG